MCDRPFEPWPVATIRRTSSSRLRHLIWGLIIVVAACRQSPTVDIVIEIGTFPAEVRDLLGQPERTQAFVMPETPFFGPQEGLADLIPPGTAVAEWVYVLNEEKLYIWFAGEAGQAKELWPVICTTRYPAGAVY